MALLDTLNEVTSKSRKCKVERLLATVDTEDALTLRGALVNRTIKPFVLTRALRKEYGQDAVTEHSVSDWRRRNLSQEVDGL